MKALIDGDILLYAIGSFTNPHPFLKDANGDPLLMPCSIEAIHGFCDDQLKKITEGADCDEYVVYVSGPDNFRKDIAKTHPYKFKRKDAEKPYHYQTVKDYLLTIEDTILTDGIEADDALANDQTTDTVICTIDKDLLMVPGLHYNWRKEEYYEVDYDTGLLWFMTQLLTGDWSTDSIIGCGHVVTKTYGPKAKKAGQTYDSRVGIGPKAAENLLMGNVGIGKLHVVRTAYQAEFGMDWKTKLNEMANLLGMGLSKDNLWSYDERSEDYRKILPCLGAECIDTNASTGDEF
jgi:hypothetical protein